MDATAEKFDSGIVSPFEFPEAYERLLDTMPEPSFLFDRDGTYIQVFGGRDTKRYHNPQLLVGKNVFDVFAPELANDFLAKIQWVLQAQQTFHYEYTIPVQDVELFRGHPGPAGERTYEGFLTPVSFASDEDFVIWNARCITQHHKTLGELNKQKKELKRISQHDHLTCIYNRFALEELLPPVLRRAQETGQSIATVMVDLDYFKLLNDYFGHLEGDRALIKLGALIRHYFQPEGYCFRYGGDEFFIVMFGEELLKVEERLLGFRRAVHEARIPNPNSPISEHLTVTIGVHYNQQISEEVDIEQLVSLADKALYNGKAETKNTISFV
ncbi:sensor domain-containing diguanylate cyclase [Vibrio albus]|nr:sensor domain-containing diguanylate cyclase [Vibrio albus]